MGVGIVLLIIYGIYALGSAAPAPDDLRAWAVAILVYIGVCIVAGIVVQILFHIVFAAGVSVKEGEGNCQEVGRIIKWSLLEDERDRLIELKSTRMGYNFAGKGFCVGLIALAAGVSTVIVLHIMAGSFALGAIVEGCMIIYLNEGGVHHG